MEATINKRFLLSTLAEVGAHNRREQEEQCWRRYHLETVANRATVDRERNEKGSRAGEMSVRHSGGRISKRVKEKDDIRNRIGGSPGRRKVQQDSSTRKAMEDTRAEWAQRKRLKMESAAAVVLSSGKEENKNTQKKRKKSKKQKLKKKARGKVKITTTNVANTTKNVEKEHARLVMEAASAVVKSFANGMSDKDTLGSTHSQGAIIAKKRKKKKTTKPEKKKNGLIRLKVERCKA